MGRTAGLVFCRLEVTLGSVQVRFPVNNARSAAWAAREMMLQVAVVHSDAWAALIQAGARQWRIRAGHIDGVIAVTHVRVRRAAEPFGMRMRLMTVEMPTESIREAIVSASHHGSAVRLDRSQVAALGTS